MSDVFQAEIDRHNAVAMAGLSDSQRALTHGDHWVRFVDLDADPPIVEFGHIWTAGDFRVNAEDGVTEDDCAEAVTAATEVMVNRGLMFGKAYSLLEPDGEIGYTHKAQAWPIPVSLFEAAEAAEWRINRLDAHGRALLEIAFAGHRAHFVHTQAKTANLPDRQRIGAALSGAITAPDCNLTSEDLERMVDAVITLLQVTAHG